MRTVVYASRALHAFDDQELLELLVAARAQNRQCGVTGMLVYAERSFLQQVEGEHDDVELIWKRIRSDGRHHDLRLLSDHPTHSRVFGEWSMGFSHPDDAGLEQALPGYRASVHSVRGLPARRGRRHRHNTPPAARPAPRPCGRPAPVR